MLEEESATSPLLNESVVSGLIGPFLSDIGANVDQVCSEIVIKLSLTNESGNSPSMGTAASTPSRTSNNITTNDQNNTIRKPFNAGDFLNEAQSGFIDPYLGLQVGRCSMPYQRFRLA